MFNCFFMTRRWLGWGWLGASFILFCTWLKVEVDIELTYWYGGFYDTIQRVLSDAQSVPKHELYDYLWQFVRISVVMVLLASILEFVTRNFIFRWRTAMYEYYMSHWSSLRHIEGASQRIQEDTMRFARIVEDVCIHMLRAIMTLIAFQPMMWELSKQIHYLPYFGDVDHLLIYAASLSAVLGSVGLALVGVKLPGLEFNNQKAEAAFRKELVLGEDDESYAKPQTIADLYQKVRSNYLQLYRHFLYFDLVKWSYVQFSSALPLVLLVPAILSGIITLGTFRQALRVFGRFEDSLNFFVYNWKDIVELISVYQRLRAFEGNISASAEKRELAALRR